MKTELSCSNDAKRTSTCARRPLKPLSNSPPHPQPSSLATPPAKVQRVARSQAMRRTRRCNTSPPVSCEDTQREHFAWLVAVANAVSVSLGVAGTSTPTDGRSKGSSNSLKALLSSLKELKLTSPGAGAADQVPSPAAVVPTVRRPSKGSAPAPLSAPTPFPGAFHVERSQVWTSHSFSFASTTSWGTMRKPSRTSAALCIARCELHRVC